MLQSCLCFWTHKCQYRCWSSWSRCQLFWTHKYQYRCWSSWSRCQLFSLLCTVFACLLLLVSINGGGWHLFFLHVQLMEPSLDLNSAGHLSLDASGEQSSKPAKPRCKKIKFITSQRKERKNKLTPTPTSTHQDHCQLQGKVFWPTVLRREMGLWSNTPYRIENPEWYNHFLDRQWIIRTWVCGIGYSDYQWQKTEKMLGTCSTSLEHDHKSVQCPSGQFAMWCHEESEEKEMLHCHRVTMVSGVPTMQSYGTDDPSSIDTCRSNQERASYPTSTNTCGAHQHQVRATHPTPPAEHIKTESDDDTLKIQNAAQDVINKILASDNCKKPPLSSLPYSRNIAPANFWDPPYNCNKTWDSLLPTPPKLGGIEMYQGLSLDEGFLQLCFPQ